MSQHSDQGPGAGASSAPAAAPVDDGDGGTLTAGGILTVASILVLFVILAFGLSSVQFCLNFFDDRRRGGAPHDHAAASRTRRRGVDPELLRSLPVTVYRAAAAAKDGEAVECAVCLAELEDGEEARFLPRCGHGFHAECVDAWLAAHTTCPLCRLTVAKQPDDARPPPPAPVPRELPASVLLGVPDHRAAVSAATPSVDRGATTMQLVIEIPAESTAPTACDAAKSPGSARLRTIRRLWSFGRQQQQGPGSTSSSCSCAGGSEQAHVEQGITVTVEDAQLPSEAATGATRGAAV